MVWFVSNCNTFSGREDYVFELSKSLANVSVYGKCSGKPYFDPIVVGWEETYRKMSKTKTGYRLKIR